MSGQTIFIGPGYFFCPGSLGRFGPKAHVYIEDETSDTEEEDNPQPKQDLWGSAVIAEEQGMDQGGADDDSSSDDEDSDLGGEDGFVPDILLDEDAKISSKLSTPLNPFVV